MPAPRPSLSRRIGGTDPAPFDRLGDLLRPGVANLSQGMVHWGPPAAALEAAHGALDRPESQRYTPDRGLTELREELVRKVGEENGLRGREVMVTAGGNQAFINLVMALCDSGDEAILFTPYYFNHLMAFQMAGVTVRFAPCGPDHHPDLERLPLTERTKAVVLVNPTNPTGAVTPPEVVHELTGRLEEAGAWLISDEPYEDFHFQGAGHTSPDGEHVLNLYSFSKSYGMASHRIGYIAHSPDLAEALVKVQDTVTVCAPSGPAPGPGGCAGGRLDVGQGAGGRTRSQPGGHLAGSGTPGTGEDKGGLLLPGALARRSGRLEGGPTAGPGTRGPGGPRHTLWRSRSHPGELRQPAGG